MCVKPTDVYVLQAEGTALSPGPREENGRRRRSRMQPEELFQVSTTYSGRGQTVNSNNKMPFKMAIKEGDECFQNKMIHISDDRNPSCPDSIMTQAHPYLVPHGTPTMHSYYVPFRSWGEAFCQKNSPGSQKNHPHGFYCCCSLPALPGSLDPGVAEASG